MSIELHSHSSTSLNIVIGRVRFESIRVSFG